MPAPRLRIIASGGVVLTLPAVICFLLSCSRPPEVRSERPANVQQWEYKVILPAGDKDFEQGVKKIQEQFNATGADGWEFAGSVGIFPVFKRPKK